MTKTKILIAGGTGLIGSRLIKYLPESKYDINILSRSDHDSYNNVSYFKWSPDDFEMDSSALDGVTAIVNLAGAGIADARWTDERKKLLISSRVNSCKTLVKHIQQLKDKPELYFGASAVGFYGDNGDSVLTTESAKGEGFLADVTQLWEEANTGVAEFVERQVTLRIGIVLSTQGGALKEILKPAKAGVYGYFGDGSAYYSWIHIDDICKIIKTSIEDNRYMGMFNGTTPNPVTIYNLVKTIKKVKNGFGLLIPTPKFALKAVMGEMADMLFNSTRVIPNNLEKLGFRFDYSNLENALSDILENNS